MDELKSNIATKLVMYRKKAGLTQLEVAEKLCYSDKSVSKWERGESTPDISVLNKLAEIYGVTLDDIISEETPAREEKKKSSIRSILKQRNFLVSIISILAVWALATIVFVFIKIIWPVAPMVWLAFIYAIPASFLVAFILCEMWSNNIMRCLTLTGLIWTMIVAMFLTYPTTNMWLLFLIPAPIQIMVLVWFIFKARIIRLYRNIVSQKSPKG